MARIAKKHTDEDLDFLPNTLRIAELADEVKAIGICGYDVRGLTTVADSFVICSASSEPQFKAIYNKVREGMKEVGVRPLHSEGTPSGGWLLLDFGTVIFHVFREEARQFYDLEGLWGDAPAIDLDLDERGEA